MNSSGGKTPSTARPPAYKAIALAKIRNELSQFANSGESSSSGQQSPQPPQNQQVSWSKNLLCDWSFWKELMIEIEKIVFLNWRFLSLIFFNIGCPLIKTTFANPISIFFFSFNSHHLNRRTSIARFSWYVKCSLKLASPDLKWVPKDFHFPYQSSEAKYDVKDSTNVSP